MKATFLIVLLALTTVCITRECEGGMWTFHSMTHIAPMGAYNCMNAAVPCAQARYSFQAEDALKEDYDTARSMTWRWGYCENATSHSAPWVYGAHGTTWRYSVASRRRLGKKKAAAAAAADKKKNGKGGKGGKGGKADKKKKAKDGKKDAKKLKKRMAKSDKDSKKKNRRLRECEGGFWTFHSTTHIAPMGAYNCMNAAVPCAQARYSFQAEDALKEDYDTARSMTWRWGYCEGITANSAPWVYGAHGTTWRYSNATNRRAEQKEARRLKAEMTKSDKASKKNTRRLRECEGGFWTFHSTTHIAPMGAYNCMNAAVPCAQARYSFQAEDALKEDYDTARSMTWRWGYCEGITANSAPWVYGAHGTTWRYSNATN